MRKALAVIWAAALVGCTSAVALEPIPGSITYNGQPRSRLAKAPAGSPVSHQFQGQDGRQYHETYIIQPDRSLKLVDRYAVDIPID
ncbi:hypothetical protein ACFFP0_20055 [Rhizobium puerariae]|uniref:Transmembrane protein n=1 Tax=Rhizobium puerariae TaxID=1585791 RepID=A0ABV6AKJ8_9HYPH